MIYGIIAYVNDPDRPGLRAAAEGLRTTVAKAVAAEMHLHARNQFWLERYDDYGHSWLPETSPKDVHEGMLFFLRKMDRRRRIWSPGGISPCFTQRSRWLTGLPKFQTKPLRESTSRSAQPLTARLTWR